MRLTKYRLNKAALAALATAGTFGLTNSPVKATTQMYFDLNSTGAGFGGTTGTTYSWDDAGNWANEGTNTAYTTGTDPTGAWLNDGTAFARFRPAATSYTVTVSGDEKNVGLYEMITGVTLTINQAPSTSGTLDVRDALQGFLVSGSTSFMTINAPISGNGGVEEELSGQLSLFGNNTFTGGFAFGAAGITNYNNVNSFGATSISFMGGAGSISGIVRSGSSVLTIPNPIFFAGPTGGNFVGGNDGHGGAGTIWSGNVTLPATGVATFAAGTATDVTKFSGQITGGGGAGIAITNPGTIIFSNDTNNFVGGVNLLVASGKAAGELVISSDGNVGGPSANIDFSGGVLGIAGNTLTNINSHGNALNFTAGGFDIQSATNVFTFNRDMSNDTAAGYIKRGPGTLVINNFGPGAGTISLVAGTLVLQGLNAQGAIFTAPTVPASNGVDIHGKLVFDYTTPVAGGNNNPKGQVLSSLTTGYGETPKFSKFADPLFSSANSDATKGLGWWDDGTKVTVKLTYYGDSNLDGIVNALDFNALATNYGDTPAVNPNSAVWSNGDYNYDGSVDSTDFGILAANFGKALPGSADLPEDGSLPADGAQSLGSLVPEPTSLALLAIGAAMGARRKRH